MYKGRALNISGEYEGRIDLLKGEYSGSVEDEMGWTKGFFTVIQGQARTNNSALMLKVFDNETGDYLDFATATEIKVIFKTNDPANPLLTLTKTGGAITVVALGRLAVALTEAQATLLAIGDGQDFELEADFPAAASPAPPTTVLVNFHEALTVQRRLGVC